MNAIVAVMENARVPLRSAFRRIFHWNEEGRAVAWQTIFVTAFFAILLGTNLIFGAVVVVGAVKTHFNSADTRTKLRFVEFKRPLADGTSCRFVVFDNQSGEAISDEIEPCSSRDHQVITRRPAQFNWGKW